MRMFVIVKRHSGPAVMWELQGAKVVVGRSRRTGLKIDDPSISRSHAMIYVTQSGEARMRDLGSKNGIRVKGRKIGDTAIPWGEAVRMGECHLFFLPPESSLTECERWLKSKAARGPSLHVARD